MREANINRYNARQFRAFRWRADRLAENRVELAKGFGRDRGKQRLAIGKMPVGRRLRDPKFLGERADVDGFRTALLGLPQGRLD